MSDEADPEASEASGNERTRTTSPRVDWERWSTRLEVAFYLATLLGMLFGAWTYLAG